MNQLPSNYQGIVLNGGAIEESDLYSYLREYWCDDTTSPRGVEPRIFIKEIHNELAMDTEENITYELREWLPNGTSILIQSFDTEEEAELKRLGYWYDRFCTESSNNPSFIMKEEYEEFIKD